MQWLVLVTHRLDLEIYVKEINTNHFINCWVRPEMFVYIHMYKDTN